MVTFFILDQFFDSAEKGNLNKITKILDKEGDELVDKHHTLLGNTALILAASHGHLDVVTLLLKRNAKIDNENKHGNTALIAAASKGHENVVGYLLNKGADINHVNQYGNTALMMAAYNGHYAVVNQLVAFGGIIDNQNISGDTALIQATNQGRLKVAELLLKLGAMSGYQNNCNESARTWADKKKLGKVSEELAKTSVVEKSIYSNQKEEIFNFFVKQDTSNKKEKMRLAQDLVNIIEEYLKPAGDQIETQMVSRR